MNTEFTSQIPKCMICHEHFDTTSHIPHLFGPCGHSFCKACIVNIYKSNEPQKIPTVCPTCKGAGHLYNTSSQNIRVSRNYGLLDLVESTLKREAKLSKNCVDENPEFICMETKCPRADLACLCCMNRIHFECDPTKCRRAIDVPFIFDNSAIKDLPVPDWNKIQKNIDQIFVDAKKVAENWVLKFKELLGTLRPATIDIQNINSDYAAFGSFYEHPKLPDGSLLWKKTPDSFSRYEKFREKIEEYLQGTFQTELSLAIDWLLGKQIGCLWPETVYPVQNQLKLIDPYAKGQFFILSQLPEMIQGNTISKKELDESFQTALSTLSKHFVVVHLGGALTQNDAAYTAKWIQKGNWAEKKIDSLIDGVCTKSEESGGRPSEYYLSSIPRKDLVEQSSKQNVLAYSPNFPSEIFRMNKPKV